LWLCLLWISLICAQPVINFADPTLFNITTLSPNPTTGVLEHNFYALDLPSSIYTLRLFAVFEGTMLNGRVVQLGMNQLPGMTYAAPVIAAAMNNYYNFSFTATANGRTAGLLSFTLANSYFLKISNHNVCPDPINGRFCVKFTVTFNWAQTVQNSMIVFVWQLLSNQVIATTMNPLVNGPQVINNLGYLHLENNFILTDMANTVPQQNQAVRLEIRADNNTNNGIWAVYQLGTAINAKVTHDPGFGIDNTGTSLTTQIVTIALSIGIVLVFLVILGCSAFIYNGNTQNYYRKLRRIEEADQ